MHPGTSSDAFSLQLVLSHKNRRCADFTEQHLRVSDRDYLGMGQEPAFSRYPSVSGRADGNGDVTRHGQAIVASCGARSPRNSKIRARSQATSSYFLPQSEKILSHFLLLFLLGEYPERSSGEARRLRRPTTLVSSRGDHLLLSDSANDRETFRRARRGRTPECPCGGADLSRIPKDDARASRRTVLKNDRNLVKRVGANVVPRQTSSPG